MSYQCKIDGMVGGHSSQHQSEVLLRLKLSGLLHRSHAYMPYGYPRSVYHPRNLHNTPKTTHFEYKPGGILSNGVPKVLSGELIDGYLLGLYNPGVNQVNR